MTHAVCGGLLEPWLPFEVRKSPEKFLGSPVKWLHCSKCYRMVSTVLEEIDEDSLVFGDSYEIAVDTSRITLDV